MKGDLILETHVLRKVFGSIRAVDGVSIRISRGQIYGFLGPNGSGKTTTIGMILGLLYPTSGTVSLFGERVTPYHTHPLHRVGALVGAPALLPYLSARQNLELLMRLNPETHSIRIEQVLELVGLEKDARRRTSQFSTGMKQRLWIAMSLLSASWTPPALAEDLSRSVNAQPGRIWHRHADIGALSGVPLAFQASGFQRLMT